MNDIIYVIYVSENISNNAEGKKLNLLWKWTWFRTYVNKHKIGFKINYNQTFKLCQKDKQIIMFSWKKNPNK